MNNNIIQFNLDDYLEPRETNPLFQTSENSSFLFQHSAGKKAQESGAILENIVFKVLNRFKFEYESYFDMTIFKQFPYEDLYKNKSLIDFLVEIVEKKTNKTILIMIEVKQLGGVQSHFQKLEWFFNHAERFCLGKYPLMIYDYNKKVKSACKKINSLNFRIENVKKTCKINNINVEIIYLNNIFNDFLNKDHIDNLFLKTDHIDNLFLKTA
jgi:hypothetical protein